MLSEPVTSLGTEMCGKSCYQHAELHASSEDCRGTYTEHLHHSTVTGFCLDVGRESPWVQCGCSHAATLVFVGPEVPFLCCCFACRFDVKVVACQGFGLFSGLRWPFGPQEDPHLSRRVRALYCWNMRCFVASWPLADMRRLLALRCCSGCWLHLMWPGWQISAGGAVGLLLKRIYQPASTHTAGIVELRDIYLDAVTRLSTNDGHNA